MTPLTPVLDAHVHVWSIAHNDYGWLDPSQGVLWRDFALEDFNRAHGGAVRQALLVQAAPATAETRRLLALADRQEVAGVVGWVDFFAPDGADEVARISESSALKGLRPMLQDDPAAERIVSTRAAPALAAMVERGLAFDALVRPAQLPLVTRLADQRPDLTIVLDHGGKPDLRGGADALAAWAADVRALAERPNVACKLSGLLTEAAPGAGGETLAPAVNVLLEAFGTERLLYGGDWPVLTAAAPYPRWLALARSLTPPEAHPAIFDGNARRLYRLETA